METPEGTTRLVTLVNRAEALQLRIDAHTKANLPHFGQISKAPHVVPAETRARFYLIRLAEKELDEVRGLIADHMDEYRLTPWDIK